MNPSSEIFDQINKSFSNQLMCIKSQVGSSCQVQLTPIWLYHARRTSGIAFYYALKTAIESICTLAGISEPPVSTRVDVSISFQNENHFSAFLRQKFSLIASHVLYGEHEKFSQNFKLVSIVREPYSRLRSAYLSGLMRAQKSPTLIGFGDFLNKPENQNSAIRQICAIADTEEVGARNLDDAIRRLTDEFDAFVTTQDTTNLIGYYLSAHGLPNVVMERPNRTKDQYQLDTSQFEAQVRKENIWDTLLFEFVRDNRRLRKHQPDTEEISAATVIVREKTSSSDSVVKGVCIDTLSFNRMLAENPPAFENLNTFWSTVPNPWSQSK